MLVLMRRESERIIIDGGIIITVVESRNKVVKLGIEAPPTTRIYREEIWNKIEGEKCQDP